MARSPRRLQLRRDDRCAGCARELPAGELAVWDPTRRVVRCVDCDAGRSVPPPVLVSEAGASARREYERRRTRRESRVRKRWGALGGVAVALGGEPTSERAWRTGSAGEVALARKLERWTADAGVELLHDRRMPNGRANVDHLAVAPAGVFVLDAKRYKGRIAVDRRGTRLLVGGRDRTKLVDGLRRQMEAVNDVVGDEYAVRGVLCFVDGDWPLFGTLRVGDVPILPPRKAARLCSQDGPLDAAQRHRLAVQLAAAFVPA